MKRRFLLAIAVIMFSLSMVAAVNASPVWQAKDGNVNFLVNTVTAPTVFSITLTDYNSPNAKVEFTNSDLLAGIPGFGSYSIDLEYEGLSDMFTLSAILGTGSTELTDYDYFGSGTSYQIVFKDGESELELTTFQIDASPVPIPATALLFCSSILGIVGIRRKISK